jgi:hypothetical protein
MKCKSLLLVAFFISACTSPKLALDTQKVSFNELLDFIHNEQEKLKTLDAGCRVSVESEEFNGNFFAQVYYVKTDSLLLSVSGPFGIQAGTLFIGKERFVFYNQLSNKFYNGTISDFENSMFFQFPLKLNELVNIFAGREEIPTMKINEYTIVDGAFLIRAQNGGIDYNIHVDNTTGHIIKTTAYKDNEVLYTKEYSSFIKKSDLYFPQKIRMIRPGENQAVSIYYTRVTLNEYIDPESFIVNIADHAEQINYFR